jgi:hypothetical protein
MVACCSKDFRCGKLKLLELRQIHYSTWVNHWRARQRALVSFPHDIPGPCRPADGAAPADTAQPLAAARKLTHRLARGHAQRSSFLIRAGRAKIEA